MSQQASSLAEVATRFLATLPPELRQESQQELNRFVRWYGGDRSVAELSALEIAEYAEGLGSGAAAAKKLEPVKNFLSYAKKEKLTKANLSVHLRLGSGSAKKGAGPKRKTGGAKPATLTSEGYAALESELSSLKEERPRLAQELHQAAADKDFRENAPLDAAKERQGQIEARIRDLEAALKSATILDETLLDIMSATIGCNITLRHLDSGEEMHCTLVSPSEADPTLGKLSIASPIGKALFGHRKGEVIEVSAPIGTLHYRIEEIKH
jgi:transcription elongation factor GreA